MDTIEPQNCCSTTSSALASGEKVIVVETKITVSACRDAVVYDFNADGAPSDPGYDWNT
ncbi:hypothetical protein ACXHMN_18765 [Rhizobium sp. LEGMi12c]